MPRFKMRCCHKMKMRFHPIFLLLFAQTLCQTSSTFVIYLSVVSTSWPFSKYLSSYHFIYGITFFFRVASVDSSSLLFNGVSTVWFPRLTV
ncbi:hypothetical protein V8F20_012456 [Naviculisporaceae sp. PSN 640]